MYDEIKIKLFLLEVTEKNLVFKWTNLKSIPLKNSRILWFFHYFGFLFSDYF